MKQTDLLDLKANKVLPKMVNLPMVLAALDRVADLDPVDLVLALEVEWAGQVEWVAPIDNP